MIQTLTRKIYRICQSESAFCERDKEKCKRYFILNKIKTMANIRLSMGPFMVGLGRFLGMTGATLGILGNISMVSPLVQLLSGWVMQRYARRKAFIAGARLLQSLVLLGAFLLPSLLGGHSGTAVHLWVIFLFLSRHCLGATVNPARDPWIGSLLPLNERGGYYSREKMASTLTVLVVAFAMGRFLDYCRSHSMEAQGYLLNGLIILSAGILNVYFLSRIYEPKSAVAARPLPLKEAFLQPVRDRSYRWVVWMNLLWNMGFKTLGGYLVVFLVTVLGLSNAYIIAVGAIESLVTIVLMPWLGRIADRKSWNRVTLISISGSMASCLFVLILSPENYGLLLPVLYILLGIGRAGMEISLTNIDLLVTPQESKTLYMGGKGAYVGIAGISATLLFALILEQMQASRIRIGGISAGPYQVIFFLSILFMLAGCLFFLFKVRPIVAEREGSF